MPFHFILATPEEKIIEKEITLATLPGKEGYLGILEGHIPMLVELDKGKITISESKDQKETKEFFIDKGYAHVTPTMCTVLVERTEEAKKQ